MTAKLSFILFAVYLAFPLVSSNLLNIDINDQNVRTFNVQVREYTSSRIISAAQFRCMGTLISFRHVLTAASCVWAIEPEDFLLMIGTTSLDRTQDSFVELWHLSKIEVHPDYVHGNALNANLAVLTVGEVEEILIV
jgi:secreted trypsin-like serine protease